jgi:alpha-galactosidase
MEAIRAAAGREVTLLGCGAPLGSMLGLIEANRIGADVSGDWTPSFNGINFLFKNEPAMPSARNSIRNILTRAMLHQHWWINDPDCLLIRPDTHLSLDEVRSLASAIALTGGSLLVSDDLPKLPVDRLRIAEALLPVIGERARVIDWFDAEMPEMLRVDQFVVDRDRHILAKFNWSEHPLQFELTPESYNLPDGGYHVREFWDGKIGTMSTDAPFTFTIPPHGCAVFTAQLIQENSPAYLGSDLHISQGMELHKWEYQGERLEVGLRLPRKAKGHVYISVPADVESVKVNDQVAEFASIAEKIYEIPVEVDGFCTVEITLK